MSKEPKEQPKTINLDDWTDKQLATLRRDSVSLATSISGPETNLNFANDIYNFIKDGKLPSLPSNTIAQQVCIETPEPKTGGWK